MYFAAEGSKLELFRIPQMIEDEFVELNNFLVSDDISKHAIPYIYISRMICGFEAIESHWYTYKKTQAIMKEKNVVENLEQKLQACPIFIDKIVNIIFTAGAANIQSCDKDMLLVKLCRLMGSSQRFFVISNLLSSGANPNYFSVAFKLTPLWGALSKIEDLKVVLLLVNWGARDIPQEFGLIGQIRMREAQKEFYKVIQFIEGSKCPSSSYFMLLPELMARISRLCFSFLCKDWKTPITMKQISS
jgi:hypothetical protein